jgi:hypothetical protein
MYISFPSEITSPALMFVPLFARCAPFPRSLQKHKHAKICRRVGGQGAGMCRGLPVGGCSEVRKLIVPILFAFLPAAVDLGVLNGGRECYCK